MSLFGTILCIQDLKKLREYWNVTFKKHRGWHFLMGFDENTGYLQQNAWEKKQYLLQRRWCVWGFCFISLFEMVSPTSLLQRNWWHCFNNVRSKVSFSSIYNYIPCPHEIKDPLFAWTEMSIFVHFIFAMIFFL